MKLSDTADAYWGGDFSPTAAHSMAEKYAHLREVIGWADPAQTEALRGAARRWPGCLREARRVSGAEYARRGDALSAHIGAPTTALWTRAHWRDAGLQAVVLWRDLHRLVGDIQAWRAVRGTGADRFAVAAFLRYAGARSMRWPASAQSLAPCGEVSVRTAERRLAGVACMTAEALREALFSPAVRANACM